MRNFLIMSKQSKYLNVNILDREIEEGGLLEGEWRNEQITVWYGREAGLMRDTIATYFMNQGAIPFQWAK